MLLPSRLVSLRFLISEHTRIPVALATANHFIFLLISILTKALNIISFFFLLQLFPAFVS